MALPFGTPCSGLGIKWMFLLAANYVPGHMRGKAAVVLPRSLAPHSRHLALSDSSSYCCQRACLRERTYRCYGLPGASNLQPSATLRGWPARPSGCLGLNARNLGFCASHSRRFLLSFVRFMWPQWNASRRSLANRSGLTSFALLLPHTLVRPNAKTLTMSLPKHMCRGSLNEARIDPSSFTT